MMSDFKIFDIKTVALTGRHLIEASAGTGKTWSISALVLRMVIEQGWAINEILVVTFTKAATQELKDRIRAFLRDALLHVTEQELLSPTDPVALILAPLCKDEAQKQQTIDRLSQAVLEIDSASIYTIHGFCQRILSENAFSAQCTFGSELLTSLSPLEEMCVQDFWRSRVVNHPNLDVEKLYCETLTFEKAQSFVQRNLHSKILSSQQNDVQIEEELVRQSELCADFCLDQSLVKEFETYFIEAATGTQKWLSGSKIKAVSYEKHFNLLRSLPTLDILKSL
jgi:ATP-dependent exoDNAse (exonuclease V) beta subunit